MKRKKSIILSLENINPVYWREKGVVLISSMVLLIIVSVLSISIMTVSYNSLSRIKKILDTSEKFYTQRIAVESIFNYTVALLVKNQDGVSWSSSISGDMKDLLDNWKGYVEDKLPGESQKWIEIYNKIVATSRSKDITKSSRFQQFISEYKAYYQNSGINLDEIVNNLKIGVFKIDNANEEKELILVNSGKEFFWAIKIQKTLNQFLFLTNKENGIYFTTGEIIDGPVYTTDCIHTSGSPIFKGEVIAKCLEAEGSASPVFENGFSELDEDEDYFTLDEDFANDVMSKYESKTMNVEEILASSPSNPVGIRLIMENRDIRIDSEYVGKTKGRLNIYIWSELFGWVLTYTVDYEINEGKSYNAILTRVYDNEKAHFKFNGIILSYGNMYVGKTDGNAYFNGLITLASKKDIYIKGNIFYSDLKGKEYNIDQYKSTLLNKEYEKLNLVAYDNVIMRYYVPDDLYITASIFALKGKFTLEGYDCYGWIWGCAGKKDTLYIYGAIIQKSRGPVGTFHTDENGNIIHVTGFKKHYVYDPRLYDGTYPEGTPSMAGKARIVDIR